MKQEYSFFRILIIEDDPDRIQRLQSWLPSNVKTVVAKSAGRAIGVLQRDKGNVYAGILFDHDLQEQAATESDKYLSGTNILDVIIKFISRDVPILVHSMNDSRAPIMANKLTAAGFYVTRLPMSMLTKSKLMQWIEEAREIWEDLHET